MVPNRDRKSFGSHQKIPNIAQTTGTVYVFDPCLGISGAESFCMSKSSRMMDPTRSREMPSCSDIDLAEIRRSSQIIS